MKSSKRLPFTLKANTDLGGGGEPKSENHFKANIYFLIMSGKNEFKAKSYRDKSNLLPIG